MKDTKPQIKETQRTPYRLNVEKILQSHESDSSFLKRKENRKILSQKKGDIKVIKVTLELISYCK